MRRGRVGVGHRHAAGVDQRARKGVARGQGHDRAAQPVLGRRARRQEARGAARDLEVLRGGRAALGVVAVEQRIAGLALHDQRQLPAQVGRVLDAAVAAARAEGAHDVGRVADEEHAAVAEALEQVVAVAVGADPDELELHVRPELLAQPRAGHLGPADVGRVAVLGHLVVDAPDAVGHQVLPDGAAFVEGRVDPGPALDRQRLLEAHVADAPAVGAARGMGVEARAGCGSGCWRRWHRSGARPRSCSGRPASRPRRARRRRSGVTCVTRFFQRRSVRPSSRMRSTRNHST